MAPPLWSREFIFPFIVAAVAATALLGPRAVVTSAHWLGADCELGRYVGRDAATLYCSAPVLYYY